MGQSNKNAVFFTVDESFLPIALATAWALSDEKDRSFDIVIMLQGEPSKTLNIPEGVVILSNDLVQKVPSTTDFSRPWGAIAYARIFSPAVLGKTYDRLLYLDGDVAAFGPVSPLFELDLAGAPLAAVEGMLDESEIVTGFDVKAYKKGLGIADGRVFNSGVLLIDPKRWCEIDHEKELDKYVRTVQPNLTLRTGLSGDQDYLNHILAGQWRLLSPGWNFQRIQTMLALEVAVTPSLVHYTGFSRPWMSKIYPFGYKHINYYTQNLKRAGLTNTNRYLPKDYCRRIVVNHLRGIWFDRLAIKDKRRKFTQWKRARDAYLQAIAWNIANDQYADVSQGITKFDLTSAPLSDIGFEQVCYHRGQVWPRLLTATP